MATRVSYFDFDWWIVQKRAVHVVALILLLCAATAAAGLYVWKYGNPLRRVAMLNEVAPGARFISFEGDVRVIRTATRWGASGSLRSTFRSLGTSRRCVCSAG